MRRGWLALGLLLVPFAFVGARADARDPGGRPVRALVRISAGGCAAVDTLATGWLTDGGLVVTVAHAVRGSTSVRADGAPARVVSIDNRTDVAALAPTTGIDAAALSLGSAGGAAPAWLARFRGTDGARTLTAARSGPVVTTTIDEPVDDTRYSRKGFSVSVAIDHGDSGAPVVDGNGRVTGMMFATARDGAPVAYAVAAGDIRNTLEHLSVTSPSVDTGRCN